MSDDGEVERPTDDTPTSSIRAALLSPRMIGAIIVVVLGLIVLVVAVGLIQGTLDPTGVALALCTMLGGIVTGVLVRDKGNGG